MGFEIKTYSRKQAGVIYSAMKRGDIEVSADVIATMYDNCGSVEVVNTNQSTFIEDFAAGIKIAVDAIFAKNYDQATQVLASFAA